MFHSLRKIRCATLVRCYHSASPKMTSQLSSLYPVYNRHQLISPQLAIPLHFSNTLVSPFSYSRRAFNTPSPRSSRESSRNSDNDNDNRERQPLTIGQRILSVLPVRAQNLWKRYGLIFVGNYLTIYVGSVGIFFVLYDTGLLVPSDMGGMSDMVHDIPSVDNDIDLEVLDHTAPKLEHTQQETQEQHNANVYMFILNRFGLESYAPEEIKPWMGNLAIAWLTSKLVEPIRMLLAITTTPPLAKLLGYRIEDDTTADSTHKN